MVLQKIKFAEIFGKEIFVVKEQIKQELEDAKASAIDNGNKTKKKKIFGK